MADDTLGSLEKMRQRLYAQGKASSGINRKLSRPGSSDVPHQWKGDAPRAANAAHPHVRYALRFFLAALGFFVLAMGVAAYLFLSGGRSVSTNHVAVSTQGPTTIAGGDTVSLLVSIVNNNPVPLEDATLSLTFPAGSRSATDVTKALTHDTEDLGTIAPGAHVERTIKAVLFGGQGDTITIPIEVQFQTAGSNATFVKESSYALSVVATPLSVSIDTPSETTSGQPLSLVATVRSNATTPLSGVVLQADYPTGFSPTDTSPKPVGNVFPIGSLAPGETSQVRITGTLAGQDGEQRVFRFTVGTADTTGAAVAVAYMNQQASVAIVRPFLATTLSVNNSTADQAVVSAGTPAHVSVSWQNTLDEPITNARIEVKLSGASLDAADVQAAGGVYRSADQTIVFNRDSDPSFASLAPGAHGNGSFTFTPKITSTGRSANPSLTMTVSVFGERLGQGDVPQTVTSSATKVLKIATALTLDAYALHATGPFTNTGPIPPQANKATTYAVMMAVHNTTSDVAGATVTTNLPDAVQFVGPVSPGDASIVYDKGAHTVTWTIGDMVPGASRTGAFQVSFTPSTSQHGVAPSLTGALTLTGFDRFAQANVSASANAVTTDLSREPGAVSDSGTVQ